MFQNCLEENINSSDPLYSKLQKVYIKTHQYDDKSKDLRVIVDFSTGFSKVSQHVLQIKIMDDEDPYFLYSLILNESDYHQLKASQGLLVDFYNFPSEIVKLLEECSCNNAVSPKFLLMLEEEKNDNFISKELVKTYLKIVEANNFKHLCHIQLQLCPGDDNEIKKLMLKKIKFLREAVIKNENCISQLKSQVSNLSEQLSCKNSELTDVYQKWNEDKLSYKVESSKEISLETEKLRKAQIEWQFTMQKERNEIEEKFLLNIKEKENELSKLRLENQIITEKKNHFESCMKEQSLKIESLEKELTNTKWDLSALKKQSAKLDLDYHEKEKSVHGLKTKLAVAEQELKDKTALLSKLQEMMNSSSEHKNKLEDIISEKDRILQRKQATIENLSDEIDKANEIISKLQKDIGVINSKLKVRTAIALEQEKVVEMNKKKIEELDKLLHEKDSLLSNLQDTESDLRKTVSELKGLLESKDKAIKDNERIIEWLNHKVNDAEAIAWSAAVGLPGSTPRSPKHVDLDPSSIRTDVPSFIAQTPRSVKDLTNKLAASAPISNKVIPKERQPATAKPGHTTLANRVKPVLGAGIQGSVLGNSSKHSTLANNNSNKKSSKPVGFKRVSVANEVTGTPSSYFAK